MGHVERPLHNLYVAKMTAFWSMVAIYSHGEDGELLSSSWVELERHIKYLHSS